MKKSILNRALIGLFTWLIPGLLLSQICPQPIVNLGNDTILCPGTSIYLDAGEHTGYLWSDGSEDRYLLVSEPGAYSVTVMNECGNSAFDEINLNPGELPEINFSLPAREYFCSGEIVDITAEVSNTEGSVIYQWLEPSSEDATISVDTTRNLSVIVTNEDGCQNSRELKVDFQFPFEEEKILLASYDPSEDKNIVIFSKTPEKRTQSFAVYSGNTENDLLGYAGFNNVNLYVDKDSDPHTGPAYYNLRVVDSCDNLSELRVNKAHRTIHLTASTLDGRSTKLEWGKYLGFEYDYFYVYRGTDPERMQVVDSVKNDLKTLKFSYTDTKAEIDILYYYSVRINTPNIIYLDNDDSKKAGSGPFVHSLSNLEDNLIRSSGLKELEYMNQYLRVYPNPAKSFVEVSFKLEKEKNITISIYDLRGKNLGTLINAKQFPGEYNISFNPVENNIQPGIYILRMEIENSGSLNRKLIVR